MAKLVFISHSCNEDPQLADDDPRRMRLERARSVRDAIVARLDGTLDVWLDRDRLRPGDPWRLEIYRALHRCSAGVILLHREAFDSDWVTQEATILNFRRQLNPGLILVPVLLDKRLRSRFKSGAWRALALRDNLHTLDVAEAEAAEGVAEKVAQRLANLAELRDDPGMESWVGALAGGLWPVAMRQPDRLTAACERLGILPGDWAADNGAATRPFARALLSRSCYDVAKVANVDLRPALPSRDDRRDISRLLTPIWVDLSAAGCTGAVLQGPASKRRLLLNTADETVADEYVQRALHCANGTTCIRSSDVFGEDGHQRVEELEKLVIDAACRDPLGENPSPEAFGEWLRKYDYRHVVLFVHALPDEDLGGLLDKLGERFPGLTVFLLVGAPAPDANKLVAMGVTVVEPALAKDAESEARQYRHEIHRFVGDPNA